MIWDLVYWLMTVVGALLIAFILRFLFKRGAIINPLTYREVSLIAIHFVFGLLAGSVELVDTPLDIWAVGSCFSIGYVTLLLLACRFAPTRPINKE